MKFKASLRGNYDKNCFKNIPFTHENLPVYKLCILGARFNNFVRTSDHDAVLSITLPEYYELPYFDGIDHNAIVCLIQDSLFNIIRSDNQIFNIQVIYSIDPRKSWTKEKFMQVEKDWEDGKFRSLEHRPYYQKDWAYSNPNIRTNTLLDFYRFLLVSKYNML